MQHEFIFEQNYNFPINKIKEKGGCIKIRYTLFSYPLVKETYNKTKP